MSGAPVAVFHLLDHNGQWRTQADFSDKYLLVYFGFTHCRVVCPRSLGKLSMVLEGLNIHADQIVPLFVTVDPTRDSPEAMKAYLESSYPRFLGLTGSEDDVKGAKKAFRVFSEYKADDQDPDGYVVPHSGMAYFMSPEGQHLDHFGSAVGEEDIQARITAAVEKREESISDRD